MNSRRSSLCALCLLCVFVVDSSAAPPTLAPLFPAGAQRGTTLEIASPAKLWSNSTSLSIEPAKDKAKFAVKVAADAVPGTYWLRAVNDDGASNLRPFIVGTLPEVMEKEPNDEPKQPQALADSCVVNGKLAKAGDVDCFAITAKKGQTLVASLEANRTLKSPMDSVLQIVSADGFVLDENHDFRGLDPQIMYSVPKDGTYIVRIFAFPSQPDTTIRFSGAESYIYRLTVTTGGFLDSTVPLSVNPKVKTVAARGWNIPAEANTLPVANPQPFDSRVAVFHPKLANPFHVRVERPAETASTHQLSKPGDAATVRFPGKKGQTVSLTAESRSLGLAVDPIIRVLAQDGKQLARAEPPKLSSDTGLAFTPPADGEYTAAVSDLYGGGGPRHALLLRIGPLEADYELTVAADRFVVPPGKPLEVPVKIVRKNGFSQPIEIAAEGLPAGVKFALKPPGAKPDPNLITIEFTADAGSPGGAFRLIGNVKDQPALSRVATAPLAEFETSISDLWVSVSDSGSPPAPKKKKK
jgi:hypothetical protein